MFFVLSKVLDLFFAPLTWSFVLLGVGVWAQRKRRAKLALGAPIAAAIVLYAFSIEPTANALLAALESSTPKTDRADATYDAVILLGGLVDDEASHTWGDRDYSDAVERLHATFESLRAGHAKAALLSGGSALPGVREPEAVALAAQLAAWGIEKDRLVLEPQSRNTHENAVETVRIARERGWSRLLLVTSAMHMKRAAGCFRAEGLEVDTLPVDHRSHAIPFLWGSLLPRAEKLGVSSVALREHFGRVVYRARGYSAAWP